MSATPDSFSDIAIAARMRDALTRMVRDELDQAGLVEAGPRKGTFVKFAPPTLVARERRQRLQPHLQSLIAESRVLGFSAEELRDMLDEALKESGREGD